MTEFTEKLLEVAAKEVGVMEQPLGSNRGPRVDEYLRSVGLDPTKGSWPWCAAFCYWCFRTALSDIYVPLDPKIEIPPRTAGVIDHWSKTRGYKYGPNTNPIPVGAFFLIDEGHGLGHMGIVEVVNKDVLTTIEGNTNEDGSRNGVGVFRRKRRLTEINKGFISYE